MTEHEVASDDFDPYHKWLGIPKEQRPPSHYQLLAISDDEWDSETIRAAVRQRQDYVRKFVAGPYKSQAEALLYELQEASVTLLSDQTRKKYDANLGLLYKRQAKRARASGVSSAVGRWSPVGEESGLLRQFLGIMSVILVGFVIMAAVAYRLDWIHLNRETTSTDAEPAQQPAPPPVAKQPPVEPPKIALPKPAPVVAKNEEKVPPKADPTPASVPDKPPAVATAAPPAGEADASPPRTFPPVDPKARTNSLVHAYIQPIAGKPTPPRPFARFGFTEEALKLPNNAIRSTGRAKGSSKSTSGRKRLPRPSRDDFKDFGLDYGKFNDQSYLLQNVVVSDGILFLDGSSPGNKSNESLAAVDPLGLDQQACTIAIRCKADLPPGGESCNICAIGRIQTWFRLVIAEDRRLIVRFCDQKFEVPSSDFDPSDWNVIACAYDLSRLRFRVFLNGNKAIDAPLARIPSLMYQAKQMNDRMIQLCDNREGRPFRGWIDEVTVYNGMLTLENLARLGFDK